MQAGDDSILISARVVDLTGLLGLFRYQFAADCPQSVGRFIQHLHSAIVSSANNQCSWSKIKDRNKVLHTELVPTPPPPITLDMVGEDDDIILVLSAIDYNAAKSIVVYPHVDPLVTGQDKVLASCYRFDPQIGDSVGLVPYTPDTSHHNTPGMPVLLPYHQRC